MTPAQEQVGLIMKIKELLLIGWALCLVQPLAAQSYLQDTIPETVVTATGTTTPGTTVYLGLTVVQQRIIAIFAFATLMWIMEPVPAWATSIAIMAMLLFFASDSGIKWICEPEQVEDRPGRPPGQNPAQALRPKE